jgi:phospholipase C
MDEEALRRRDFLQRAAYTAGLAGAATVLPADLILREAAQAQARRVRLPRPRNIEIDHFVLVMMENRSFDHYFGWLSDVADGIQQQTFRDAATGQDVATQHASNLEADWQGCGHPDPGHGWNSGRAQLQGGFLAEGSENDIFALSYYNEGELQFIHEAAKAYTLHDRFFCSALTSTWPNRYYEWSATAGGRKTNAPPVETAGNQWPTIFDRALARGLTANYFPSDLPFAAVWGARAAPWIRPLEAYYQACAAGTLPNISIVDPPFRDGGGGDGLSADEHPHGDVRLGQAWMADVVRAFVNSPNYRRGALFIIYDEWGGFFDHVRPPRVPDERASRDLNEDWGQMGFRIPAVTVSPYTRRRGGPRVRVNHDVLGFESILKLIAYRFGLAPTTVRERYAKNIGRSFDWDRPDFERPDLPDPVEVASAPCSLGGDRATSKETEVAHASDLAALAALAHRFDIPVYDGKVDSIFTRPDALLRAVKRGRVPDYR